MSTEQTKNVVIVPDFHYHDNGISRPADSLLSVLVRLTDSEKNQTVITEQPIADYLQSKGYVTPAENNCYALVDGAKTNVEELADKVSDIITSTLASCITVSDNTPRSIFLMPITVAKDEK